MKPSRPSAGVRGPRLALLLLLEVLVAPAAIDARAEPPPADEHVGLEEIVVTAQKRESTVGKTAISMTAFDENAIEQLGIQTAIDLSTHTPNISIQTGANGSSFFVVSRGVTMGDTGNPGRDPSTAIYFDGVYMGATIGNLFDVVDLERVEVLRGPQGVLYGRNANGGAINFITRKPTGQWGGRVLLRGGNLTRQDLQAVLDFPILGGEGFRVPEALGVLSGSATFMTLNQDAFYRNLVGPDVQEQDRLLGRVSARWDLREDALRIDYSYDKNHAREQGPEQQLTNFYADRGIAPLLITFGVDMRPFASQTREDTIALDGIELKDELDLDAHALTIRNTFDDLGWLGSADLKSITGYRNSETQTYNDFDGTSFAVLHNQQYTMQSQITQEIDFVGGMEHDWGRLDYTLGYFYFYEEIDQRAGGSALGSVPPLTRTTQANNVVENWAHAAFLHLDYTPPILEERLGFEVGIRYTHEDRTIASETFTDGVVQLPLTRGQADFDAWTPMGTVRFALTDEINSYFTVSRGFTSGGFSSRAQDPQTLVTPYRPEFLTNFELGFKARLWDNRIRVNAAGFYMDYTDMQRTQIGLVQNIPTSRVVNAGQADIWGAEIELQAMPTEGLLLNASYGLTRPEFQEYIDLVDPTDPSQGVRDYAGERGFGQVPEHNVSLGAQYSLELSWAALIPRLDYYWQSRMCFLNCDNPDLDQSPYGLLGARLTLDRVRLPGNAGNLSVSLWGKNLLDRSYKVFGVDLDASTGSLFPWTFQQFGSPRTWGIDVNWRFGSYAF